jgi:proteasome lid subunit RPN8/RPN11
MEYAISSTLLGRMLGEAKNSPDREVCGLLFGKHADETGARIDMAEPCANVAAAPGRSFEIDPAALFAAHRAARAGGPALIGHYHSHPSAQALPSARDAAQAMGDGALWLILGADEARLFVSRTAGAFEEVALIAGAG